MGIQFKGGALPVRRFHWHRKLEETKFDMGLSKGNRGPAVHASFVTAPDWAQICSLDTAEGIRHIMTA